jgi:hypothetical protein
MEGVSNCIADCIWPGVPQATEWEAAPEIRCAAIRASRKSSPLSRRNRRGRADNVALRTQRGTHINSARLTGNSVIDAADPRFKADFIFVRLFRVDRADQTQSQQAGNLCVCSKMTTCVLEVIRWEGVES